MLICCYEVVIQSFTIGQNAEYWNLAVDKESTILHPFDKVLHRPATVPFIGWLDFKIVFLLCLKPDTVLKKHKVNIRCRLNHSSNFQPMRDRTLLSEIRRSACNPSFEIAAKKF